MGVNTKSSNNGCELVKSDCYLSPFCALTPNQAFVMVLSGHKINLQKCVPGREIIAGEVAKRHKMYNIEAQYDQGYLDLHVV